MHSQSLGIVNAVDTLLGVCYARASFFLDARAATFPSEMLSQAPTKGVDAKVESIVYNPTDNGAGIAESGL